MRGPSVPDVEGMLRRPCLVLRPNLPVQGQPGLLRKRFPDALDIAGVDQPAGAQAAFEIVHLRPAENRRAAALFEGQRLLLVAHKHAALRGGGAGLFGKGGHGKNRFAHGWLLLAMQAVHE